MDVYDLLAKPSIVNVSELVRPVAISALALIVRIGSLGSITIVRISKSSAIVVKVIAQIFHTFVKGYDLQGSVDWVLLVDGFLCFFAMDEIVDVLFSVILFWLVAFEVKEHFIATSTRDVY